jgi:sulfite reductase (NADPH) flavoprotein alpha-component
MTPQGLFPDDPVPLHHFASDVFYSSPQELVQQVAYSLSDKIFTYSPDTFELDQAVKRWRNDQSPNVFGFVPGVHPMETRLGAGAAALGYVFSPDFDISKRHVPQSIIASSGSLLYLRDAFSQLSLLHALTNPVAAHINAACYSGGVLASDYVTAMQISDELGFGLVSSLSHREMQSMALYATLLAKLSQPTLNVYDGLSSRDTVSVRSPFSNSTLQEAYEWVLEIASGNVMKHTDNEGKALIALNLLNSCLETSYRPFEYCGRRDATHVLVAFGTTEAELSGQIVRVLSDRGLKVGVVHVRLYRPFISEEFSAAVPESCRNILVLGQVDDQLSVEEVETHSLLYQDVIASMDFNLPNHSLQIRDGKYSRQTVWDLTSLWDRVVTFLGFQLSFEEPGWPSRQVQLSTWALDGSPAADVSSSLVQKAAGLPASRVHVHIGHDNLTQGGITKCDITIHGTVATGNSPAKATLAFVGSAKILEHFDVLKSVKPGGAILVALTGVKDDDLDRKLPANFRQALDGKNVHLWILDITASPLAANDQSLEAALAHFAASSVLKKYGVSLDDRLSEVFTKLKAEDIDSLQSEADQCLREVPPPESAEADDDASGKQVLGPRLKCNSFVPFDQADDESVARLEDWTAAAKGIVFKEAYEAKRSLRPDAGVTTSVVHVKEHRRLTPMYYDRNVFHIEFDIGGSGLTYAIGEALGIHAENDPQDVQQFIRWYGLEASKVVQIPSRESPEIFESRTIYQALAQNVDMFGKPPKRFYEALAEFAKDENDRKKLLTISLPEGTVDFKKRAEVDNITYADILQEFPSAHPAFADLVRIVGPLKRREYSIASAQHVTPTSVALLIVTVEWRDPAGRERFGLATRYLNRLRAGDPVTVSVKPSVMKLPAQSTAPIIMAGLGTGLAPFRAFVQERAYQKTVLGQPIGSVLLYLGSRHRREEYLYGEEWEAYQAAGVVTLVGKAFSRDQPHKIYIQDRMRQTMDEIRQAYFREEGSFYLCGPTWPVPDVTEVLQEAVERERKAQGARKVDGRREIETLKDAGRFVLEVY